MGTALHQYFMWATTNNILQALLQSKGDVSPLCYYLDCVMIDSPVRYELTGPE